jgi:hypothetical protein
MAWFSVQVCVPTTLTTSDPTQVSLVVQTLPSSQEAPGVAACWQRPPLQVSAVHWLPSSQLSSVPAQVPLAHTSPVVQALPSLQDAVLLACVQPLPTSQASSVQTLPSSQLGAGPPTHDPPAQVSLVVQALPSLHGAALLVCVQPVAGLQASSVQTLPSSQFGAGPPTQLPPEQVSAVVQAFPSSQGSVFGVPPQSPPPQMSPDVQALPSLQAPVLLVCVHPLPVSQASSVQGLPSSQFGAGPPTQEPPEQASPTVQALPSLQGAVLLTCVQPVPALQPSSVQVSPSSQSSAGPPTQVPPEQASVVVQALPSSQGCVLFTCWHTPAWQASSVQALPSSQSSFTVQQPTFGV